VPNHNPEHPRKERMLRITDLTHIFGDLSEIEKRFEIKPPLAYVYSFLLSVAIPFSPF
jgi:hypothetical protein